MLAKKVVTLMGAAGVLVSGACFLPPLPVPRAAPPPIFLDLQGVRTIGVDVSDDSAYPNLDTARLAHEVASAITERGRRVKLNGITGEDAANLDGTLKLTIESEEASVRPAAEKSGHATLDFQIRLSAVLKKRDGTALWNKPHEEYFIHSDVVPDAKTDLWKDPRTVIYLTVNLGSRVVNGMLRGQ